MILGSTMRTLTHAEFRAFRRNAGAPGFFSVLDVPEAKPRRAAATHVPRQGVDPVAAAVWLALIPLSAVVGWYGAWRLICLIWNLL